jgi:hypothetical protein
MKISDERIPQRNAKSYSTGRGRPLRLPSRSRPGFSEDVPIAEARHPVDGQPAAYVFRNRTCTGSVTTAKALIESCAA